MPKLPGVSDLPSLEAFKDVGNLLNKQKPNSYYKKLGLKEIYVYDNLEKKKITRISHWPKDSKETFLDRYNRELLLENDLLVYSSSKSKKLSLKDLGKDDFAEIHIIDYSEYARKAYYINNKLIRIEKISDRKELKKLLEDLGKKDFKNFEE